MFKTWLSSFFKKNKQKLLKIAKSFAIVIFISIAAGLVFSRIR